jgi:hypothetical protein
MSDTIKVAVDTTMPVGRCVVLVDGDIVYGGPIRKLTADILDRPGALMLLSPVDFADGEAFMKATRH